MLGTVAGLLLAAALCLSLVLVHSGKARERRISQLNTQPHPNVSTDSDEGGNISGLPDFDAQGSSRSLSGIQPDGEFMARSEERQGWQLRVSTVSGEPIDDVVIVLWPINEELIRAIEQDLAFDGSIPPEVTTEIVCTTTQGVAIVPKQARAQDAFLIARRAGYLTTGKLVTMPLQESDQRLVLEATDPLSVKVMDSHGLPVSGVRVYFMGSNLDPTYTALSWRQRLQERYFFEQEVTDADGSASIPDPTKEPLTVSTAAGAGYSQGLLYEAERGKTNVLVVYPSFRVHGAVHADSGEPIGSASVVMFAVQDDGSTIGQGETLTAEDGTYIIEGASTKAAALRAMAFATGYSSQQQVLARPVAHRDYQFDFTLNKGEEVGFRLNNADGTPADGIVAHFLLGESDWVPGYYKCDADGRFTTTPSLVAGSRYWMEWFSGGIPMGRVPVAVPPEAPLAISITLPALARIRRVEVVSDEPASGELEAYFFSDSGMTVKPITWKCTEPSPWLPAGTGMLQVALPSGALLRAVADLPAGWTEELRVAAGEATLAFELPDTPGSGAWAVSVEPEAGGAASHVELRPGAHRLPLNAGWYSLQADLEDQPPIRLTRFFVPPAGLDLGMLEQEPLAAIAGRVLDPQGLPWPRVLVRLLGESGAAAPDQLTGEQGQYEFAGLPAGSYRVQAQPAWSLMIRYPDVEAVLTLAAGDSIRDVDLTVAAEHTLLGEIRPLPERDWTAFRVLLGRLELAEVSVQGTFVVGTPTARELLGAFNAQGKEFEILTTRAAPGSSAVVLDSGNVQRKEIQFLDAAGKPLRQARCTLEAAGVALPRSVHTDREGRLVLVIGGGEEDLALALHGEGMLLERIPISRLPNLGTYSLSPAGGSCLVQVLDRNDHPVPGAILSSREADFFARANGRGECVLPGVHPGSDLRAEKNGFWPVQTRLQASNVLVLRRPSGRLEIEVPGGLGAENVRLEPDFDLGYEWSPRVERAPDQSGLWIAGGLPEGTYAVTALDGNGAAVTAPARVECLPGTPVQLALVRRQP